MHCSLGCFLSNTSSKLRCSYPTIHLRQNWETNGHFVHAVHSDRSLILFELIKRILESPDLEVSHQWPEFNNTGCTDSDADFNCGPEEHGRRIDCSSQVSRFDMLTEQDLDLQSASVDFWSLRRAANRKKFAILAKTPKAKTP